MDDKAFDGVESGKHQMQPVTGCSPWLLEQQEQIVWIAPYSGDWSVVLLQVVDKKLFGLLGDISGIYYDFSPILMISFSTFLHNAQHPSWLCAAIGHSLSSWLYQEDRGVLEDLAYQLEQIRSRFFAQFSAPTYDIHATEEVALFIKVCGKFSIRIKALVFDESCTVL